MDSVPTLSETAEDHYVMHTLSNPSAVYWTQNGRRRLTAISPEELALRVMNISVGSPCSVIVTSAEMIIDWPIISSTDRVRISATASLCTACPS